jgi:two-component sensor histidine kinase
LRLQIDDTEDKKIEKTLTNIKNRILSINHLYALLNTKENLNYIDAHTYFSMLVNTIQKSYHKDNITTTINTSTKLPSQIAVYCGFILNETLTNALQHAFVDRANGHIDISMDKHNGEYIMSIRDNGIGFDNTKEFHTLGLSILESLAIIQLRGELNIKSIGGTDITIKWREKDE